MHHPQPLFHHRQRDRFALGKFLDAGTEIPVVVEIADHRFRGRSQALVQHFDAQLRSQMVPEVDGIGKERLKRGTFGLFGSGSPIAWVEVIVEKFAEIDLFERVRVFR